ncbi:hypothetical protein KP626_08255 [Christensenella sp. MSJ-20]|mgnify:FL=1|uniref:DUF6506 family protein n=1 Tax=Christensenella sp. MSJ-20 TaxID=2841518 RepID=UPI000D7B4AA6|nr:MAG: hypothetical protein DBY42_01750 [Bacillota bacterium]QWT55079.1 hypothetical protein KP626_08255 [Christensenella sp. MSJ-20]
MSKQFRFAFIVMSRGFDPSQNHAMMEVDSCKAVLVGVARLDQACAAAQHLISTGEVDRIELCGAFGEAGAKAVQEAVGKDISVSYIVPLQ